VENLAPAGFRSPDRPALSESLYRLRYPSPLTVSRSGIYSRRFERTYLLYFQMLRIAGDSLTLTLSVSVQKTRVLNVNDLETSNLPELSLFIIIISCN